MLLLPLACLRAQQPEDPGQDPRFPAPASAHRDPQERLRGPSRLDQLSLTQLPALQPVRPSRQTRPQVDLPGNREQQRMGPFPLLFGPNQGRQIGVLGCSQVPRPGDAKGAPNNRCWFQTNRAKTCDHCRVAVGRYS